MTKKLIAVAVLTLSTLSVPAAYALGSHDSPAVASLADVMTDSDFLDGSFSFQGTNGLVTVDYSGAAPVRVAVGENTLANQNYNTVGTGIKSVFGINDFNSDAFQIDSAASIMNGGVASFVSTVDYNYLAIHFGRHEMFFDFGATGIAAGTAFNVSTNGKAAGVSNFRAYSDIIDDSQAPTVPVPAAFWLFGSGLLGLIGFRKKAV